MKRAVFFLVTASALSVFGQASWFDLTLHNAVWDSTGTNLVSGEIHPLGALPSLSDFNAARIEINEATVVAGSAMELAIASSNAAAQVYADVVDTTSNGLWEVVFTLSALRGVGSADDIESKTVGFSVETTSTNRLCHAVQWFSTVPPSMPDFNCTYNRELEQAGFTDIPVSNSYPDQHGTPEEYGQHGGACYRVTVAVPLEWGQCFFKITATGFILRGNALPIVGGVAGGASYDIAVLDAVGLTNVTLNIRGGFCVDTNNPISIMLYGY
jgi:hypothetical protein